MGENTIFLMYLASFCLIGYAMIRQAWILNNSTNGTRFTQWTFLVFNISFFLFVLGALLELKGVKLYQAQQMRAFLILIMSVVGFVFYSQNK